MENRNSSTEECHVPMENSTLNSSDSIDNKSDDKDNLLLDESNSTNLKEKFSLRRSFSTFFNKCRKPDSKMVKNSLFCGVLGMLYFVIGFIALFNALLTFLKDRDLGKKRIKRSFALIYHNIVPFFEVASMVLLLYFLHSKVISHNFATQSSVVAAMSLCVLGCFVAMFFICLLLRITNLREDCCESLDIKSSCNENSIFVFPYFSVKKDESLDIKQESSFVQSVIDFTFTKLFVVPLLIIAVVKFVAIPFKGIVNFFSSPSTESGRFSYAINQCKEKDFQEVKGFFCASVHLLFGSLMNISTFFIKYNNKMPTSCCVDEVQTLSLSESSSETVTHNIH